MTPLVFAVDPSIALKRRRIIDDAMHDKSLSTRREFACHVDTALAVHDLALAPLRHARAHQAQICADIAAALSKLRLEARPATDTGYEMIREQLYLAAKRSGAPHANAVSTAAQQIDLLRAVVNNAGIAEAAETASRADAKQRALEDSFIRDLAHYYDEDFAARPSTSKGGLFSKLLRRLFQIEAHDDRLNRIFSALTFTGAAARKGNRKRTRKA